MNMEEFLPDIKEFLEDNGITVPIYQSTLPAKAVPAIAISEYPGEAPDTLVDIDKPRIQAKLQVANDQYKTGRGIMADIQAILHKRANTQLSHNYIILCEAISGPFPLADDPEGNVEFLSNFRFQVR